MQFNPIFLFELLLFNGVLLSWAGYEYWTVRKAKPKGKSAAPDQPGHPEG